MHLSAALVKNNGNENKTHQWEMDTTYDDIKKVGNHRNAAYIRELGVNIEMGKPISKQPQRKTKDGWRFFFNTAANPEYISNCRLVETHD